MKIRYILITKELSEEALRPFAPVLELPSEAKSCGTKRAEAHQVPSKKK
jgi:hypothetical protein